MIIILIMGTIWIYEGLNNMDSCKILCTPTLIIGVSIFFMLLSFIYGIFGLFLGTLFRKKPQ